MGDAGHGGGGDGAPGVVVRVYCTADDDRGHVSLVEALTSALRARGAPDAVVLRASRGFGPSRRFHDVDAVDSGMNHPVVVEWVDTAEGFESRWPAVRPIVAGELVTLERVVLAARPSGPDAGEAP